MVHAENCLKAQDYMLQKICKWLLYKRYGWQTEVTVKHPDKYIICLAPHTSNRDFFIGQLYMRAENMRINFMMKKEWFVWPLGVLFKKIGGIPVYRSKHTRMTDQLSEIAKRERNFCLCITPEGTRSLNPCWKKGFYYIALKSGIPILLYGLDYKRHLIQCTKSLMPTGDIDKDMKEIKEYFKNFTGRYPERFTTGD